MNQRKSKQICWQVWPYLLALASAGCSVDTADTPSATAAIDGGGSDVALAKTAATIAKFSPEWLEFGAVDIGKCVYRTASLSNWGNAPLTAQGLDLAALDSQFTVEWLSPMVLAGQAQAGGAPWLLKTPLLLQPQQSAGLSLRYCPTKAGTIAAKMPLLSDGGPLALAIEATGVISKAPCFTLVRSTSVAGKGASDFGSVMVGYTRTAEFMVGNCEAVDLVVTKIVMNSESLGGTQQFAVDWSEHVKSGLVGPGPISIDNPLVIKPNDNKGLRLSYSPVHGTPEGKLDTGNLLLQFSGGYEHAHAVSGRGVTDPCPIVVAESLEGTAVVPQTLLHLSGAATSSPIGAAIKTYQWTVKQPDGSKQSLKPGANVADPTLQADVAGEYEFCLDAWDEFNLQACKPGCVQVQVLPLDKSIHIELLWDTPEDQDQSDSGASAGADLDLHLAHPLATGPDLDCDGAGDPWFNSGLDAFWFHLKPAWDAVTTADDPSLDLDDVDGAGPENMNVETPPGSSAAPIAYSLGVHYWNDHGYGFSHATVLIYLNGALHYKITRPNLKALDMWYVGKLYWPNTASGGSKKPFAACYQTGNSCSAGKSLMWAAAGAPCVTPCYRNKEFLASSGGAAVIPCKVGPP